jgi:hypothetical protein
VKTDNRIENLRDVAQSVNLQNLQRARKNRKSSRLLGVSHSNRGTCLARPYRARIVVDGRELSLGTFATEQEAHQAYLAAKRIHHEGCVI